MDPVQRESTVEERYPAYPISKACAEATAMPAGACRKIYRWRESKALGTRSEVRGTTQAYRGLLAPKLQVDDMTLRSLCICASYDYNRLRARPLPYYTLPLPFVNLREFMCKSPILWRATIDMLKCCPSLKSLTLCYLDEWPISLLRKLTKLQTLHLYAYNYRETPVPWRETVILNPAPTPYASITTLTLHSRGGSSEMINECLSECHFPRLLVFAIRRCTVEPLAIFQFVHQHPTLVEVNVDFVSREEAVPEIQICIEAILQLINGTGNWFDDRQASLMGQPASRAKYHGDDIGHWPLPILVPGSQTTCYAFAYARAALDPRIPTQNQNQHQETKYKCIALALRGLCVNDADLDVPAALGRFRTVFPDVEQLRLQIDGHDELTDYATFKVSTTLCSMNVC